MFLDFKGICFVTEAPETVTRALRRYLENRLVEGGLVEKRKLSFLRSQANSPEIAKLCHQGIIIVRDLYLVPPGQVMPRPRNVYRLARARLALLAQKEGEESGLVRDLWSLFDQTGEARAWVDRSAELLEDMGDMKNLKHYLEFHLREESLVLRNLLRLMVKCGLKRDETVKKLIDGLASYTNMMLQHVDDGVRTIKESGRIVRQVFKDLPENLGLDVKSLIRSESLVREIDGRYFVECILCGFEMSLSIPLAREIVCQFCNQKYHGQEPTAQRISYALT